MGMKEKLHTGELYFPNDDSIMSEQLACLDRLYEFNHIMPSKLEERQRLMKEMFAELGDGCYIESPFYANHGGRHIHLGNNVYMNFGATMVDDTHIYIGDNTMLGPNVTVATAGHPILPELRSLAYQYNIPVHIGKNCWLGAGVIVLPGVRIGDNSVIGAGSIVTRDIPENSVAVGNPARVIREISDTDRRFYFKDKRIDQDLLREVKK